MKTPLEKPSQKMCEHPLRCKDERHETLFNPIWWCWYSEYSYTVNCLRRCKKTGRKVSHNSRCDVPAVIEEFEEIEARKRVEGGTRKMSKWDEKWILWYERRLQEIRMKQKREKVKNKVGVEC